MAGGGLAVGKTPANSVVLPFYGTGAIAFVVMACLAFFSTYQLQGHFFNPHTLAVVHTAALGWGTMVIFGACYQLLPVINEQNLYSETLAKISYYFLSIGAASLISSFWFLEWSGANHLMLTGGAFTIIAVSLFFYNVVQTTRRGQSTSIQKWFLSASAFWLLLTASIGLFLAINLSHPFITFQPHLEILKLHAHAGLAGWFLLLIEGIGAKLFPMFMLSKSYKESYLRVAFISQNLGLSLFLLDGFFFGPSWRYLLYAAMVALGLVFWMLYLLHAYKHKFKPKLDFPTNHALSSVVGMVIVFALIPVVYFAEDARWVSIYGLFVFVGWISQIILGMTFKTLPFIIWNYRYKAINGKFKIPLPRDLHWHGLLKVQFWLYLSSLYVIALSFLFKADLPLKVGFGLLVLTALAYCINVFKVLTHKTTILE